MFERFDRMDLTTANSCGILYSSDRSEAGMSRTQTTPFARRGNPSKTPVLSDTGRMVFTFQRKGTVGKG